LTDDYGLAILAAADPIAKTANFFVVLAEDRLPNLETTWQSWQKPIIVAKFAIKGSPVSQMSGRQ
jgi:hypothetical protein